MQLSRLVLPAPFGPMMALRAAGWTLKLTLERAVTPPKRKVMAEMSRRGADIRPKDYLFAVESETCTLYRRARLVPGCTRLRRFVVQVQVQVQVSGLTFGVVAAASPETGLA